MARMIGGTLLGFSGLFCLVFSLTWLLFSWGSWAADYQRAILDVGDCVMIQWAEYEARTGSLPSAEMEKEWHTDCVAYFSE